MKKGRKDAPVGPIIDGVEPAGQRESVREMIIIDPDEGPS